MRLGRSVDMHRAQSGNAYGYGLREVDDLAESDDIQRLLDMACDFHPDFRWEGEV